MASFTKLRSGSWRVQVRRKGCYVSESFQRREDARRWATATEARIDCGEFATSARGVATFAQLIDLHVTDMKEVGRAPGRSKDATLAMLRRELGAVKVAHIDRERLIRFGRKRAAQGAGPVTLSMDIGAIRLGREPIKLGGGGRIMIHPRRRCEHGIAEALRADRLRVVDHRAAAAEQAARRAAGG